MKKDVIENGDCPYPWILWLECSALDCPIDMGSNLCDFLKRLILKNLRKRRYEGLPISDESQRVMGLIQNCNASFVQTNGALCEKLYGIANSNIDIPAADVAVVVLLSAEGVDYFRILKLNYQNFLYPCDRLYRNRRKFKRYYFTETSCRLRDRSFLRHLV